MITILIDNKLRRMLSQFAPQENNIIKKNLLSRFKTHDEKPKKIEAEMNAKEIAEVVSDKFINSIKSQFAKAKIDFENNK